MHPLQRARFDRELERNRASRPLGFRSMTEILKQLVDEEKQKSEELKAAKRAEIQQPIIQQPPVAEPGHLDHLQHPIISSAWAVRVQQAMRDEWDRGHPIEISLVQQLTDDEDDLDRSTSSTKANCASPAPNTSADYLTDATPRSSISSRFLASRVSTSSMGTPSPQSIRAGRRRTIHRPSSTLMDDSASPNLTRSPFITMRRKPTKELRQLAFDNARQFTSTPKEAPQTRMSFVMTTAESPMLPLKPPRRTVQFEMPPSPSNSSIVSVHAHAVRQDDSHLLVRSPRRSRSASPENDRRRTRVHFADRIVQIDQTFDSVNEAIDQLDVPLAVKRQGYESDDGVEMSRKNKKLRRSTRHRVNLVSPGNEVVYTYARAEGGPPLATLVGVRATAEYSKPALELAGTSRVKMENEE